MGEEEAIYKKTGTGDLGDIIIMTRCMSRGKCSYKFDVKEYDIQTREEADRIKTQEIG